MRGCALIAFTVGLWYRAPMLIHLATWTLIVGIVCAVWGYCGYLAACRPFDTAGDPLSREWGNDFSRRSAQHDHWHQGDFE